MPKIAIITDSTAFMPDALVKKYNVNVIPVAIHWDGETLFDGVDITPEAFYERLATSKTLPSTSQPSAGDFLKLFEKLSKDHDGIIAPLISTGVSGTINSAEVALQTFDKVPVEIIDTHSVSGGLGMVVEQAALALAEGKGLTEARQVAEDVAQQSKVFFVVDTLKYLHAGGRIGGASRFFGSALDIKPILYLNEVGKIDGLEKVRTKKKAVTRIIELAVEYAAGRPVDACVMHANVADEAEDLKKRLADGLDCGDIEVYGISAGVGVHVGPGALGLAVYPH